MKETIFSRGRYTPAKVFGILLLSAGILNLGGCGSFSLKDKFAVDPGFFFAQEVEKTNHGSGGTKPAYDPKTPTAIDLETYKFPENSSKTAYFLAVQDSSGAERNRLQMDLIRISDRFCEDHKSAIMANAAAINVGTNILSSLFSGGAAATTAATASRTMSGIAAFIGATRSHINEEVYYKQFAGTIVTSIEMKRSQFFSTEIMGKRIKGGKLSKLTEYSINEAIRDVLKYHQYCSFYRGFEEVNKAVTRGGIAKAEVLEKAQGFREELKKQRANLTEAMKNVPPNPSEVSMINSSIQNLQRQLAGTLQLLQYSR